jgi:hypothetical protein
LAGLIAVIEMRRTISREEKEKAPSRCTLGRWF